MILSCSSPAWTTNNFGSQKLISLAALVQQKKKKIGSHKESKIGEETKRKGAQ